jgi:hypothetical protein
MTNKAAQAVAAFCNCRNSGFVIITPEDMCPPRRIDFAVTGEFFFVSLENVVIREYAGEPKNVDGRRSAHHAVVENAD